MPGSDTTASPSVLPAARPARFFGWRVAWAAFTVAVFGWGIGFYGPPVFLFAVHEARGWPIWLVSSAVTCHFLLGAFFVANLPALHRRFGVAAVTRAGGVLSLVGMLGWALAQAPWQLFLATAVSGAGWAMTGAAAINAMVSPWFARLRPAALSTAYNGASVGGIILSPLWVFAIGALGFPLSAALIGGLMAVTLWLLAGRYFRPTPAELGQAPDGDAVGAAPSRPVSRHTPLPGRALWHNRRFVTLVLASSLGLFAQIGLIAHMFSLMAGPMGPRMAGLAAGLATVCAIIGRTALGWLLSPTADRRVAAAGNHGLQVVGSLVLLASGGTDVVLLLAGIMLFGLGLGNATSLPPLIAQQDFSAEDTARAVALVTACGQASYAFAPAVFGLLREFSANTNAFFLTAGAIQVLAALAMLTGRQPSR
ncbi:MFS transporter [Roseococcus pinisoli]|uniref:MFS transporter n=1 Tax=Roseococcus pinisoli TaxID=2835040 RepID=A0ABS5QKK0_9PROT|nr:MFS transporter [Roseococcus pinisoli]MBS7813123.1 MFS transporter [Roseococcus pinisoli]